MCVFVSLSENGMDLRAVGKETLCFGSMGLKCSPHGVKATLKHRYSQCFREVETLSGARDLSGLNRSGCVLALDGNVAMMQVPQMIRPLEGYVHVIFNQIVSAMSAGNVVVMVFDEPACISPAKAEEQARRDAARKKHVLNEPDVYLEPFPLTDDYDLAELMAVSDCHHVMRHRPSRLRFVDEVVKQVLERCKRKLETWRQQDPGAPEGAVIFDGVDWRGAERPIGSERRPEVVGTSSLVEALFEHTDISMGEGDLKLAHVAKTVRHLTSLGACAMFKETRLFMTITIDTDSIAIELLEAAKRQQNPVKAPRMMGMLCMREQRSNKREWEEGDPRSVYCCLDTEMLHELLQKDMWTVHKNPTPFERRLAISFLTTGWALAGSDFTEVKGLRADVVLDTVPALMANQPKTLALMSAAWDGDRDAVLKMRTALRRLMDKCAAWMSETPGFQKRTIELVRSSDNAPLLRGAWVAAYWSGREFKENLEDFGFRSATTRQMPWCE